MQPEGVTSLDLLHKMSAGSFSAKKKVFGLIQSKKKLKKAPAARSTLSIFSSQDDDDHDDDGTGDIDRANRELSKRAAACDMRLLEGGAEDDYDGHYDDFKQQDMKRQRGSLLTGDAKEAPPVRFHITPDYTTLH